MPLYSGFFEFVLSVGRRGSVAFAVYARCIDITPGTWALPYSSSADTHTHAVEFGLR